MTTTSVAKEEWARSSMSLQVWEGRGRGRRGGRRERGRRKGEGGGRERRAHSSVNAGVGGVKGGEGEEGEREGRKCVME